MGSREDDRRAHIATLSDDMLRDAAEQPIIVPLDAEIAGYAKDELRTRGLLPDGKD